MFQKINSMVALAILVFSLVLHSTSSLKTGVIIEQNTTVVGLSTEASAINSTALPPVENPSNQPVSINSTAQPNAKSDGTPAFANTTNTGNASAHDQPTPHHDADHIVTAGETFATKKSDTWETWQVVLTCMSTGIILAGVIFGLTSAVRKRQRDYRPVTIPEFFKRL